MSWDDTNNDELANRKVALARFMKAGSQVVINYRLNLRLRKIREFLADCNKSKDIVRKKV